jgi:hypothetical protein
LTNWQAARCEWPNHAQLISTEFGKNPADQIINRDQHKSGIHFRHEAESTVERTKVIYRPGASQERTIGPWRDAFANT